MKLHGLKRVLLAAVLPVVLMVLANLPDSKMPLQQHAEKAKACSVVTPQNEHHHEATLTDATNLYRICSSRPQRIVPTHGSKSERNNKPYGFIRRQIVKPLKIIYDSRRRLETAPFCRPASSDYYVIALRHILC